MTNWVEKKPLEKTIEADGCEYAKRRGWTEYKLESPGCRGFPDRMYIRKGEIIFVEWKRDGKEPTAQQLRRHRELRAAGARVEVIDNLQQAYELFR